MTEKRLDLAETETNSCELFRQKIGLKDYVVRGVEQEMIEEWKKEVEEILEAIKNKNLEYFTNKEFYLTDQISFSRMGEIGIKGLLQTKDIYANMVEQIELTEDEQKMLAVGIWVMSQLKWKGNIIAVKPVIFGTDKDLSSLVGDGAISNCLDTAILIKFMASQFGLDGSIETVKGQKYNHRFWESDDGHIIDVWWGLKRGGLFRDKNEYNDEAKPDKTNRCALRLSGGNLTDK